MDFGFLNHQAVDSTPKFSHAFDLPRLPSAFTLTFDELQSSGLGKDYESMNMDELMKSIWSAEDTQAEESGQGSLAISRNLSLKTVDQVWKDAVKEDCRRPSAPQQQRQRTLGETTLEEFLAMAGVVKEDDTPGVAEPTIGNNTCSSSSPLSVSMFDTTGIIIPQQQQKPNQEQQQQQVQDRVFSKETTAAAAAFLPQCPPMAVDKMGGIYGTRESVPTIPCSFEINNGGTTRGRKWTSTEKVMERRQKRMIKNRESAARSRARKQAHTLELEAEVEKVKAVNRDLRRKQAEMLEIQRNQMAEEMEQRLGFKNKRSLKHLRRTSTGPW